MSPITTPWNMERNETKRNENPISIKEEQVNETFFTDTWCKNKT